MSYFFCGCGQTWKYSVLCLEEGKTVNSGEMYYFGDCFPNKIDFYDPILDNIPKGFVVFYHDIDKLPVPKNPDYKTFEWFKKHKREMILYHCQKNFMGDYITGYIGKEAFRKYLEFWNMVNIFKYENNNKCEKRRIITPKGEKFVDYEVICFESLNIFAFDYNYHDCIKKAAGVVEEVGNYNYLIEIGKDMVGVSGKQHIIVDESKKFNISVDVYDGMVTPVKLISDIISFDEKKIYGQEFTVFKYNFSIEVGEPFPAVWAFSRQ